MARSPCTVTCCDVTGDVPSVQAVLYSSAATQVCSHRQLCPCGSSRPGNCWVLMHTSNCQFAVASAATHPRRVLRRRATLLHLAEAGVVADVPYDARTQNGSYLAFE